MSYIEKIIELGYEPIGDIYDEFGSHRIICFSINGNNGKLVVQLMRPGDAKDYEDWVICPGWWRTADDDEYECAASNHFVPSQTYLSVKETEAFIAFIKDFEIWLKGEGKEWCNNYLRLKREGKV